MAFVGDDMNAQWELDDCENKTGRRNVNMN